VLVHAAAGGVGSFAVQLAKWKGGVRDGTARLRTTIPARLGADEAIDYNAVRFEDKGPRTSTWCRRYGGRNPESVHEDAQAGRILVSILVWKILR